MDGDDDHDAALDALADRLQGGEGEGSPGGGRMVDTRFLQELMYSLETVSMGTHQLLYFSARQYAGTYLDCAASDLEEAVDELASRFDSMNVGTLTLAENGMPAVLELEENVFVDSAPETGRPMCYFLAGYIAGFLEACLDDTFVVNETACVADGADAYSFTVQER